jgi:salicylate hydroxylase
MKSLPVIIAGGGIGGLAAALGLARKGVASMVLERSAELGEIGADGLRSDIRQQLVGDGEPRVSGHTTYRSVISTEQMPEDLHWNAATLWAGPKCHIVHYPLKGWKLFNLVVTYHNEVEEAVAGKPVSKDEVRQGFEHIAPRAQQIIEHGEDWKLWVLCDRDPILDWADGRVALLGDAAHPMLQYFAQGACMAMTSRPRSIDTRVSAGYAPRGCNSMHV